MALRREPTARQLRLATELRRLRDAAGLAAREAAALLGVSPVQISHIESALARRKRGAATPTCRQLRLFECRVDRRVGFHGN
ncbi:helix-turn-helix domain-containing protein [Streptomyces sp. INA 01156]